jgi:hypothetical protein
MSDILSEVRELLLQLERTRDQIDQEWVTGIRKSWKLWVKKASSLKPSSFTWTKVEVPTPTRNKVVAFIWKVVGKDFRSGKGDTREVMFGPDPSRRLGLGNGYTVVKFHEKSDEELLKIANLLGMATKSRPEAQTKNEERLHKLILDECDKADAVLAEGQAYLDRLREDLLINKGLWTRTFHSSTYKPKTLTALKVKVVEELEHADAAIANARAKIRMWRLATHPEERALQGDRRKETYEGTKEDYARVHRSPVLWAEEGATGADGAISRKLLAYLSKALKGDRTKAPGTLAVGSSEPSKVALGKMDIFFKDTPMRGRQLKPLGPKQSDIDGFRVSDKTGHRMGVMGRDPKDRAKYIRLLQKAQALLSKKGLAHLWQGRIFIEPPSDKANPMGSDFGVGGSYSRRLDLITVHTNPSSYVVNLVIHEIGHKYWFKYMSAADRAHFSKWFGKVKATSHYGSTATWEDFAEVFESFVSGKDLTRDQIDRFKSVLGKTKRLESIRDRVSRLLSD